PWVNGRWLNLFTGAVVAGLVMLSLILTTSVLYPDLSGRLIVEVLIGGSALALAAWAGSRLLRRAQEPPIDRRGRLMWRMPPIAALAPAKLGRAERAWLFALAGYLALTGGVVLVRIVQLALSGLA
ncbi:MAG TPA: manganese transporter, partial [Caulobacteraceae bacterium]|nr:manganese transporter [Caulobacteraceae bacterium]